MGKQESNNFMEKMCYQFSYPSGKGASAENSYSTVKKVSDFFPFSSRDVTKYSLAGNNLIIPGQKEFGL
jgi:hypothetical protein